MSNPSKRARSFSSPWSTAGLDGETYLALPRTDTMPTPATGEVHVAALPAGTGRGLWYIDEAGDAWDVANQDVAEATNAEIVDAATKSRSATIAAGAGKYRYSASGRSVWVEVNIAFDQGTLLAADILELQLPDLPAPVFIAGVTEGLAHTVHLYHTEPSMTPGLAVPVYSDATVFTVVFAPINATTGDIDFVSPVKFTNLGGSGTRTMAFTLSYERAQPQ